MSSMNRRTDEQRWRFDVEPAAKSALAPTPAPRVTDADVAEAEAIDRAVDRDRAWQRLLVLHMPFHLASEATYSHLVGGLCDIEELFLARVGDAPLMEYYAEAYRELDVIARAMGPRVVVDASTLAPSVRHVASLQAEFMEEVFFGFRLDRYANAPDSRGWMNLFRRWGCSPRFNAQFDRLEETLSEDFVVFYYHHVRDCSQRIEVRPVPHPWDWPPVHRATRALPRTLLGVRGLTLDQEWVAGCFLDSGIGEARPRHARSTRTTKQPPGAPPSKEGGVPQSEGAPGDASGGAAPTDTGSAPPPPTHPNE
jgi:hypothetical protein